MKPKKSRKKEKPEEERKSDTCPEEAPIESEDPEFEAFDRLASRVIRVPKSEIDRRHERKQ